MQPPATQQLLPQRTKAASRQPPTTLQLAPRGTRRASRQPPATLQLLPMGTREVSRQLPSPPATQKLQRHLLHVVSATQLQQPAESLAVGMPAAWEMLHSETRPRGSRGQWIISLGSEGDSRAADQVGQSWSKWSSRVTSPRTGHDVLCAVGGIKS